MFENISARCRAIVVFLFSAVALLLFAACCYAGQDWFSEWYGLPVGGALMLLSIPFHGLGEKSAFSYVISFLFNTAGMGFCASAYYSMTIVPSALEDLLSAILLPLGILLLTCILLTVFAQIKQPIVAIVVLLEIALVIASVVFWVIRGGDFYAFSLFSLLIAGFYTFVYAITVDEAERVLLRDISFGSYGCFLFVALAALVAVALVAGDGCDCDCGDDCGCVDCCDCGDCGSSTTKTKKVKK